MRKYKPKVERQRNISRKSAKRKGSIESASLFFTKPKPKRMNKIIITKPYTLFISTFVPKIRMAVFN